jgi:hypothetical protein
MTWLQSILIGICTAALGLVGAGIIALLSVRWYQITSFEGASGYFMVFTALFGGVAGFVIGFVGSRYIDVGEGPAVLRGLGVMLRVMAVLLAASTVLAWLGAPPHVAAPAQATAPVPSEAELAAEAEAAAEAAFAAMTDSAPLDVWLPYAQDPSPARRQAALQRIAARPGLVDELGMLMQSPDASIAAGALRLVADLPASSAVLAPAVADAGSGIARLIQAFNATSVQDDPGYQGAAEISVRFSGWMEAVRALRETGAGDFTPELLEILVLARVRTDSDAMRGDVVRVASHYMREWTGLEPLPTDPPPR